MCGKLVGKLLAKSLAAATVPISKLGNAAALSSACRVASGLELRLRGVGSGDALRDDAW